MPTPKSKLDYNKSDLPAQDKATGKFVKGNIGRPKGTKSKLLTNTKAKILSFVDEKIDKELNKIWNRLSDRDRCVLLVQLIKLTVPVEKSESENINSDENKFTLNIINPLGGNVTDIKQIDN